MYKRLVLMLLAISFLFTGCQSKTPIVSSESQQSTSQPKPPPEIAFSLEPVAFQENILLQKREEIVILDATESSILFAVYVNNNELREMEPLPSYTDRICIYNIADKQTKILKQLGSGNFCNDGVVLPNKYAVYCTIQRIEGQDTDKFTIYKKSDNQEKVIDSGFCGDYPLIVKLADGEVAYSYVKYENNMIQSYGLNKINKDDSITRMIANKEENGHRFLNTDIESNGNDVLLFHEVKDKGEFINYSLKEKRKTTFLLPLHKKIMSYCLFKKSILFCFQTEGGFNRLFIKPLHSDEYTEYKIKDYYQLHTNNIDSALSIGPSWDVEIIKYDDKTKQLATKKLEVPPEIDPEEVLHEELVRIIPINQQSYFLFYERQGKLLKLTLTN